MRILLDTDIIIDLLRGLDKSKNFFINLFKSEDSLFISVITELEVLSGKDCNDIGKRDKIDILFTKFNKVELDSYLSKKSATIRRHYKVEVPDAIIAATALKLNAILYTRNIKDFDKIKELRVQSPY